MTVLAGQLMQEEGESVEPRYVPDGHAVCVQMFRVNSLLVEIIIKIARVQLTYTAVSISTMARFTLALWCSTPHSFRVAREC